MHRAFIVAVKEEVSHIEEIHGAPVFFCGVGKVNASIGAHELIRQGAKEIINIGSCGSSKHALGEVIKIGKSFQDIDCSPICEYGLTAFDEDESFILLDPASEFTCFTTDYFYDHKQLQKYSPDYLRMINSCSVFDMELFSIAKIGRRHGVKVSAYKWVSDDGDFSKWLDNCKLSCQKVIDMLAHA
jgi:nucleoside phosphorylase